MDKSTRQRRTKIEMNEARAAAVVEDFHASQINRSKTMQQKVTRPRRPVSNRGLPKPFFVAKDPNHSNLVGWTAGQACGPLR
ncbi:hypothetical protein P9112_007581 [Eukaryota sp. TZLM1-RC]